MKLPASLAFLATVAPSIAHADAPPRSYAQIVVGGGSMSRNPGGDFSPSEPDDFLGLGTRAGYFLTPTDAIAFEVSLGLSRIAELHPGEAGAFDTTEATANRQRALVGFRVVNRRGPIGVSFRLGFGVERVSFASTYRVYDENDDATLVHDEESDRGAALEMGLGVAYRFDRYHVGVEAGLGFASHDGGGVGENFNLTYFGVDTNLLAVGGVAF